MATLEKIRNHAVLLVIVIGLALLAFLMGDFLTHGSTLFNDSKTNAIVVNGESVKIHDYQNRVDQAIESHRMQTGGSLTDMQTNQLRNQVYAQIVSQKVLDAETDKVGLTVTPEEVFDLVQGEFISPVILQSQMFTNPETGVFDKAALLQFLKSTSPEQMKNYPPEQRAQMEQYRNFWINTESAVRDYRLNEKYTDLIGKAVVANKLEVADALESVSMTADLAYVSQKAVIVPDSAVNVGDKEIKEFYEDNKEFFKTEKGRIVDVVYTTIRPSQEDIEEAHQDVLAAEKELREGGNAADVVSEYSDQEFIDAYMPLQFFRNELFPADLADQLAGASAGFVTPVTFNDNTYRVAKIVDTKTSPDSLLVRHIMLPAAGQTVPGAADPDSLLNALRANPNSFAELASVHSLDRNSAGNGGEIGWLTEFTASRVLDKDFAEKLFTLPVGTPTLISSKYGNHIVLVEKATAPVQKYLVAYVSKTADPGNETYTRIFNDMNSFLAANKDLERIDTAAVAKGYQVLNNIPVFGMQPALAPGLESSRELVKWSLDNNAGAVSDIKEADGKFAFVVVRKEIKKGYLPVEDAKEQILPVVMNEAKVDYLYDKLVVGNFSSLESFAQKVNEPIDTVKYVQFGSNRIDNIGFEPTINAAAAYAPLNKPVPVKGKATVYLVNVMSRTPDADKPTAEAARAMLNNQRLSMIRMGALQAMIAKADIEDNRARFY